ncbi:MAG: GNAT family N-acetyltransferase [Flavobacteriaceae bacterium]
MLSFRPGRLEEAEILSNLAITSKGHWGYPKHLLDLWRKDLRIEKEFISENIVKTIWVDSKLIGFFGITISEESELEHFWLLPEYIGKGYGKIAFEEVKKEFYNRDINEFNIVSDPNAESFYLSRGARRVGEVESIPQKRMLPKLKFELL